MIGFCPLASGSKGNCLYLGYKNTKILIDAGISFAQVKKRLAEINLTIDEIDAVLVTHEHMDHVSALRLIKEKTDIPVFANSETAKGIYNNIHVLPKFKIFTTSEDFEFKDLKIHPFSILHDTLDPVGFIIRTSEHKIGICTDLGFVTSLVKSNLKGCDYLYIEANHQVSMVHSSNRPYIYKQRVLSRQGHISNEECFNLLHEIIHPKLKHIYLAHLSQECNNQVLARQIVEELLHKKESKTKLSIAYQEKVSDFALF